MFFLLQLQVHLNDFTLFYCYIFVKLLLILKPVLLTSVDIFLLIWKFEQSDSMRRLSMRLYIAFDTLTGDCEMLNH